MPTQPYLLQYLYKYSTSYRLNNTGYGQQIANLYDALLGADLLALRSAYLELSSWDTHRLEKKALERHLHDVFGINGGLYMLSNELEKILGINENMVYTFTTDFGRQLAANGDKGTDHGSGNYMMVIGRAVNGGTYGELFPQREITADATGKIPFETQGADIKGLTSFERVLAEVCDWVQPGSGVLTFPNTAKNDLSVYPDGPILEPGVDLTTLFKPGHFLMGKIQGDPTTYLTSYDYPGMQVAISGPNGYNVTAPVDNSGVYRIGPVSDGQYTVAPGKDYFRFGPQQAVVQIAGDNVNSADFLAYASLHLSIIVKTAAVYTDVDGTQVRYIRAIGHKLVPNETSVTIGSTNIPIRWFGTLMMFGSVPAELAAGEITVTTPTESYTHPVRYENIQAI